MSDYVMALYDIFKQNKVTKDEAHYKKFTVLQVCKQNRTIIKSGINNYNKPKMKELESSVLNDFYHLC